MAIKSMQSFTGARLTMAAYVQYHEKLYNYIFLASATVLHLETLAPQYAAEITVLKNVIRRVSAYSETVDVTAKDKERDAILSALFAIFKGYQFVPAGDTAGLAAAAQALAPVMSVYKGIQSHELNRETVEINGMIQDLGRSTMLPHITKLGLMPLMGLLTAANSALDTAVTTRVADATTRAPQREVSTDQQRRTITAVYNDIVATINAFYLTTKAEEIGTFIDQANTLADYYRNVQANTAKKKAPILGEPLMDGDPQEVAEEEEE